MRLVTMPLVQAICVQGRPLSYHALGYHAFDAGDLRVRHLRAVLQGTLVLCPIVQEPGQCTTHYTEQYTPRIVHHTLYRAVYTTHCAPLIIHHTLHIASLPSYTL